MIDAVVQCMKHQECYALEIYEVHTFNMSRQSTVKDAILVERNT